MPKNKLEEDVGNKEQVVPESDTIVNAEKTSPVNTEKQEASADNTDTTDKVIPTASKELVSLKGWADGREGAHTVHIKEGIFTFIDGKAEVSSEAAESLRQAGYIE